MLWTRVQMLEILAWYWKASEEILTDINVDLFLIYQLKRELMLLILVFLLWLLLGVLFCFLLQFWSFSMKLFVLFFNFWRKINKLLFWDLLMNWLKLADVFYNTLKIILSFCFRIVSILLKAFQVRRFTCLQRLLYCFCCKVYQ